MITRDDWLQALVEAQEPVEDDQDAVTITEFAQMFGLTRPVAAYRLRNMLLKGHVVRTFKRGHDGYGRYKTLAAYRLVRR
jgi:hypothetical protein